VPPVDPVALSIWRVSTIVLQYIDKSKTKRRKLTVMQAELDRIEIKDLLVRGILGINPDERKNRQDILINVVLWADTRPAGASDDISDAVNYRTITKQIIEHVETGAPMLVERLAAEVVQICFQADGRIQAAEVTVEKPTALRFARSVGITIYRGREEVVAGGAVS
jgi:D-erythro-7,8-dihydroneopterin triphosphate epimerase